ncbi:phage/plasmid replication protein, II/X family [Vogesella urethralis]|uniref:phage/plasmid replication protein, II/X family n=1 Tax=Vogesella urethralis TaxID=2592656 RepID=UPI00118522D7|nr:phage/plasmid replication protein, II/X family [Vogesella urethralis]
MSRVFVDGIHMQQRYTGSVDPVTLEPIDAVRRVNSGLAMKVNTDDDGEITEIVWAAPSKKFSEGSYQSMVAIKSDGHLVYAEGNPGRLSRPDNLFNLDFDATVERLNRCLKAEGLPGFSAGERQEIDPQHWTDYNVTHGIFHEWSGATVSRLHLTSNYETGSMAAAQSMIDWLSTQSVARIRRGRLGESTVMWGHRRSRVLIKAYIKANEMLAHRHGRTAEEIKADPVYQYCLAQGIVRFEIEVDRRTLAEHHCRYLGDITMEKLTNLFDQYVDPLVNRVREDVTTMDLMALPSTVRATAAAWLKGVDVRTLLSRATYFRHAKTLREYGMDISEPLGNVKPFTTIIKVIEVRPVTAAPDWYWQHQRALSLKAAGDYPVFDNECADADARAKAKPTSADADAPSSGENHAAVCRISDFNRRTASDYRASPTASPGGPDSGNVYRLHPVNA